MACWNQEVGAARCPEAARWPARSTERGCTAAAFAEAADQTAGALGGDYYAQTPTMRGVSFASCVHELPALDRALAQSGVAPSAAGLWPCALYGDFYAHQAAGGSAACGADALLQCSFDGVPHLPGAFEPQPLPQDPLFPLERTTVFISLPARFGPQDVIGDFLQCLLRTRSTILSVDAAECSVRAKLFGDSDSCTMTATLYQCRGGEYALECQRRYGDCVAFHRAFRQVAAHFQKWVSAEAAQCALDMDGDAFSRPALPTSAADCEAPGAEQPRPALALLAPLLDGALPPAETAAALAAVAVAGGGSAAAAMLGDACAMEVVRRLMRSEEPDVVHFVSRLLQQLVAAPVAERGHGPGQGQTKPAQEQGKGCAASPAQSRVELAQVAAEAGRRCPAALVAARAA